MPRSKVLSEQMRADSQARLLNAARRLFADQGYFKTRVSDLARAAGMSQGNVYWYFEGKEGVLKALLREGFEALESMTREAAQHPGGSAEKVATLLKRAIALYKEMESFTRILSSLFAHGGMPFIESLGFDMRLIGGRYHGNLIRVFAEARDEGVVAGVDANVLAMFFFAFFNGLVLTYGQEWSSIPADWLLEASMRLIGADIRD